MALINLASATLEEVRAAYSQLLELYLTWKEWLALELNALTDRMGQGPFTPSQKHTLNITLQSIVEFQQSPTFKAHVENMQVLERVLREKEGETASVETPTVNHVYIC